MKKLVDPADCADARAYYTAFQALKSHACRTPGAIYGITIRGRKIALEVEIPKGVAIPRDQRHLKVVIHQAMESALKHLWRR